jgi:hypothetical protein
VGSRQKAVLTLAVRFVDSDEYQTLSERLTFIVSIGSGQWAVSSRQ